MSSSNDRPRKRTDGRAASPFAVLASMADVPGMLADRISDLYATEERRRRAERTERMILKAESIESPSE